MKKLFLNALILTLALTFFSACSSKSKIDRVSPCACYDIEITQTKG